MVEPQRIVSVPVASLKLSSHEPGVGPKVAQWISATVLFRSSCCSGVGRFRLWKSVRLAYSSCSNVVNELTVSALESSSI
jgi:hypothetical protein